MRFFYLILFFLLRYSLRIFYPRIKTVNAPKTFFGRTIYVSNHAASFMDPLVVATFRLPIVFFSNQIRCIYHYFQTFSLGCTHVTHLQTT